MSLDLALMVFDHIEGAERAYADVLEVPGGDVGHEVAFVEHHRHDRMVVRERSRAATSTWTSKET